MQFRKKSLSGKPEQNSQNNKQNRTVRTIQQKLDSHQDSNNWIATTDSCDRQPEQGSQNRQPEQDS
jgi:hypothetical protein